MLIITNYFSLIGNFGISSIPLFMSFIINPELFVERLSNLGILPNAVLEFIASYKSLFINLIVITLFVLKNILFSLLFIFMFILRVVSKVSNKLFYLYMFSQCKHFTK